MTGVSAWSASSVTSWLAGATPETIRAPSVLGSFGLEIVPAWAYQVLPHTIVGLFIFAFGACLGSFVNVLVYRLPAGISVVSPPSRCPVCGFRLGWRDNLPIIGWLLLRGRCRACRTKISVQYPAVELLVATLCTLLYLAYFASGTFAPWWTEVGGAWFAAVGPLRSAPLLTLHCMLLAALVAMTLIDARLAIVTLEIPIALTLIAFLFWPIQGWVALGGRRIDELPLPLPEWPWLLAALGAGIGLVISNILLRRGVMVSEAEEFELDLDAPLPPMTWLLLIAPALIAIAAGGLATGMPALPMAAVVGLVVTLLLAAVATRRCWRALCVSQATEGSASAEPAGSGGDAGAIAAISGDFGPPPRDYGAALRLVRREALFLAPALVGAILGFTLGTWLPGTWLTGPPVPLACFGGSLLGYLAGGGIIWAIRLAGTVGFGREAMGLGDVHLLAAVGAVLGWIDPIAAVVMATASGIVWAVLTGVLLRRFGGLGSAMPFGPHLAVGCMLVIGLRPAVIDFWEALTAGAWPS